MTNSDPSLPEQVKKLNAESDGGEQRSLTLFVDEINFVPQFERRHDTRIDMEFTNQQTRELIDFFTKRLELGLGGSVRVSFTGHTVTG